MFCNGKLGRIKSSVDTCELQPIPFLSRSTSSTRNALPRGAGGLRGLTSITSQRKGDGDECKQFVQDSSECCSRKRRQIYRGCLQSRQNYDSTLGVSAKLSYRCHINPLRFLLKSTRTIAFFGKTMLPRGGKTMGKPTHPGKVGFLTCRGCGHHVDLYFDNRVCTHPKARQVAARWLAEAIRAWEEQHTPTVLTRPREPEQATSSQIPASPSSPDPPKQEGPTQLTMF